MGEIMQQTELDRPTMEDRKQLEEQIKELEDKIAKAYEKHTCEGKGVLCAGLVLPEVMQWNKELRRLRRLRK